MGGKSGGGEQPADPTRREGTGWFEPLYQDAGGDASQVPWADLTPKQPLLDWLEQQAEAGGGRGAVVIGCGLGDDAEELSRRGWHVTAFDLAPTAIAWARRRFPDTHVDYQVADLYALPCDWSRAFDLVVEVYTFQALSAEIRPEAMERAADLVAAGGRLVLVCRLRDAGEKADGPPWPLTGEELSTLEKAGLTLLESVEVGSEGDLPARRVRRVYRR